MSVFLEDRKASHVEVLVPGFDDCVVIGGACEVC